MIESATRPLEWSPPRTAISRVPYLPGLDGMRALAVAAVMVYHANTRGCPAASSASRCSSSSAATSSRCCSSASTSARAGQPAAVLAAAGQAAAAGPLRAADRRHDLHGAVPAGRAGPAAWRRRRGAHVRVELVPDLGRPGVHRGGRLRPAAPPVEPRRGGAVLPAVAAGDGRADPARAAAPAGDEPVAVPRRRGVRWSSRCCTTRARSRAARSRPTPTAGRRAVHLQDRRPVPLDVTRSAASCSAPRSPWCGGRWR